MTISGSLRRRGDRLDMVEVRISDEAEGVDNDKVCRDEKIFVCV